MTSRSTSSVRKKESKFKETFREKNISLAEK